ncbi:MAG: hypothetical protein IJX17_01535 [Clostridia bacterium]|nr:hypothetical protein [Clostridia bacterium]
MKDYSSIIVSSKVKILRNLAGFKFPSMIDENDGIKVLNKVAENVLKISPNFKIYKVKTLPELDINIMREKKLLTSNLINAQGYGAVILSENENISIMINESDHIVEQCMLNGFNIFNAYDILSSLDDQIISKLDIAFDNTMGYLTSNINNIGTGLKASITLFLPALTLSGSIKEILSKIQMKGFEVETSDDDIESCEYLYTFSNYHTIGKKENEIIIRLTELATQIAEREITARKELLSFNKIDEIKDRVFRAWGILTNCYKISVEETIKLLSEIKMGLALDFLKIKDINVIENLMIDVLPYSLTKISNSKISMAELNKYRATFVANVLKLNRIK